MNRHEERQQKALMLLLAAISVAFAYILWPYFGAVFWATVLAILFTPVYRRMLPLVRQQRSVAALATLLLCLVAVVMPLTLIVASLVREGGVLYSNVVSWQADVGTLVQGIVNFLPSWATRLLDWFGIGNLADMQEKLTAAAVQASQFMATQALSIGQNTFELLVSAAVMLYLLFFLLRDGGSLVASIKRRVPLAETHKRRLFEQFTAVIRATVKGNVVVAIVQGALGGVMLWFLGVHNALLWGTLMAVLSLLPVVGAGLVWGPVALYFLFTGVIWKGVALIVFGVLVIGLVDNLLRPLLVGKDTQMPDYLVLISTLGGITLFGFNGFVIGPVIAALFIAAWNLYTETENADAR
jgi:predicted PurR-regulated permease PerM